MNNAVVQSVTPCDSPRKRKRGGGWSTSDGTRDPVITLDVGGTCFRTRASTLTNGSAYFAAMLSGNWAEHAEEDMFVDRDPGVFTHILQMLRGHQNLSLLDPFMQAAVVQDAAFFGVALPSTVHVSKEPSALVYVHLEDQRCMKLGVNGSSDGAQMSLLYEGELEEIVSIDFLKVSPPLHELLRKYFPDVAFRATFDAARMQYLEWEKDSWNQFHESESTGCVPIQYFTRTGDARQFRTPSGMHGEPLEGVVRALGLCDFKIERYNQKPEPDEDADSDEEEQEARMKTLTTVIMSKEI